MTKKYEYKNLKENKYLNKFSMLGAENIKLFRKQ